MAKQKIRLLSYGIAINLLLAACSGLRPVVLEKRIPAATPANDMIVLDPNGNPVDITPLANYLESKIEVLTRPHYVYNWFNSRSHRPEWQTQFDPSDPNMGLAHFSSEATSYFDSLCADPTNNPADCPDSNTLATGSTAA